LVSSTSFPPFSSSCSFLSSSIASKGARLETRADRDNSAGHPFDTIKVRFQHPSFKGRYGSTAMAFSQSLSSSFLLASFLVLFFSPELVKSQLTRSLFDFISPLRNYRSRRERPFLLSFSSSGPISRRRAHHHLLLFPPPLLPDPRSLQRSALTYSELFRPLSALSAEQTAG